MGGGFFLLVLSEHPQAVSLMPGDSSGFSGWTSLWWLSGQMVFQAPGRLHVNVKPLSTEVLFLVQQEYSARNRDVLFCVYEVRTEGIKPPPGIFPRGFAGGNNAGFPICTLGCWGSPSADPLWVFGFAKYSRTPCMVPAASLQPWGYFYPPREAAALTNCSIHGAG